ncbi:MAG: thioredoxin fold domain-containing protein [Gammaproteobacteria bacterium]|nr:thioredoxin fold domain-containing protein [Gammaproteobacteria bacterium]
MPLLSAETSRWYNDDQVKQGAKVFAANCAACHGKNAEATKEWRKRDANGNLVPPPLNGTAHAWHHPLKLLRHTVRKGGAPVGGTMPPFEGKLSATEIDSAIAWFQSMWSDEIYTAWSKRNADDGFQLIKPKQQSADSPTTRLLRQRLRGVEVGKPQKTEVKDLYQVRAGSEYAYLFSGGRYALIGNLIDLQTGQNLTEQAKEKLTLQLLETFPESDMVIYPPEDTTQQTLTILTDTDCPYCRKLHKEIPQLQKAGIRVRYIPFPRGGKQGKGYADMKAVWCAKDRTVAMDIAKGVNSGDIDMNGCMEAAAVDRGYEFGLKIGLRGTPAIILQNGRMLEGYVPADRLIELSRTNQSQ